MPSARSNGSKSQSRRAISCILAKSKKRRKSCRLWNTAFVRCSGMSRNSPFRLQQTIRGYLTFAVFRRSTTAHATSASNTPITIWYRSIVCSMRRRCLRFSGFTANAVFKSFNTFKRFDPPISFPRTACVVKQKTLSGMLSETKHLVLSATYEDEILRLRLRMTVATQSRGGGGLKPGGLNDLNFLNGLNGGRVSAD